MADDDKTKTAPSPEAADNAAKEVKKGRPTNADKKAAAEAKAVEEQTAAFISKMAEMLTASLSQGLALLDGMYEEEMEWVEKAKPNQKKLSFALEKGEQENVGLCIALGLQQTSPEFLAKFGFPIMCLAITAAVAIPRITLAVGLNKIAKDLEKREKRLALQHEDGSPAKGANGNGQRRGGGDLTQWDKLTGRN